MKISRLKQAGLIAGVALTLATAAPASAETNLSIENDGLTLTAGATSSEQVLSVRLRISGPDDFLFEQRVEDSLIQWVPKGDLADGWYNWELIVVTAQPGAPMRELSPGALARAAARGATQASQGDDAARASIDSPAMGEARIEIPVERLYADEFKSTTRRSGGFQVKDGWIVANRGDAEEVSHTDSQGLFGAIAGVVIDFVFPSAHAGDCNPSPCNVDGLSDTEIHMQADSDDNSSSGTHSWELEVDNSENNAFGIGRLGGSNEPFRIQKDAPQNALFIRDISGDIGLGTNTPSQPIHISDDFPRIRIDDADDAQTWYIKGQNAGAFEIGESTGGTGAFSIQPGAPDNSLAVDAGGNTGIGTAAPARKLHVTNASGPQLRLQATGPVLRDGDGSTNQGDRGLIGFGGTAELWVGPGGLWFNDDDGEAVIKMNHSASTNALVVDGGGVGIGTDSPVSTLTVSKSDGSTQLRVTDESGTAAARSLLVLRNNGRPQFRFFNTFANQEWAIEVGDNGDLQFRDLTSGGVKFRLTTAGNLQLAGTVQENAL
jgi:hypothetical protein